MTQRSPPVFTIPVTREEDRFACAAEGAQIARWAGLSERAQHELAIAIAELVSNAVRHGGGGSISIRAIREDALAGSGRWGVEVIVRDSGPGIDPKLAILEEVGPKSDRSPSSSSSARLAPRMPGQGLGVGLGAVHRLMSSVVIRSSPGISTEVIAVKWK
ncbi:ATP-binding protein [Sorangium sp. So ce296]|uniref:Serine/threonine protein kinase n=1 Tax=Sorangium cellulosum TaxID=56 RepID=A0A150SAN3_SORCE|nr:serine/threonine protein kinase [Sorangium cellulosum]KYF94345.1 serine/threonine protein kinase [Sorangium cellulosum]